MKYSLASLGDVLEKIIGGGTPSKENKDYWNGSIPWCSVKDMKEGSYRIKKTEDFITEIGLKNSASNLIPKNTVITSTRMGLGRAFLSSVDMAINQDLKALIPNSKIDKIFLLWSIIFQKDIIEGLGTGATVKGIRLETLKSIKIPLPPLSTQKKIAGILSAYDDAIENNLRRIKLLEEMAQITYEEWFVRLRFPGHTTTPINPTTGLPEGWVERTITDAISVNPRTKPNANTEAPYVPMSSLSESSMVIENIETRILSGGAKFKNGDTLFARISPCLENGKTGFVQFMNDNNSVATGSTEYIVLRETPSVNRYFIYCLSRSEFFRENSINSMVGSDGRQRVNPEIYSQLLLKLPPKEIMLDFQVMAEPLFNGIKTLIQQNQHLREARDILLPRLMTGVIDAEKYQPENFLKKN